MGDIVQTPANVSIAAAKRTADGIAGEAIDAGNLLYVKTSDGKLYKSDSSTTEKAKCVGMAGNSAAVGQPVRYATGPTQIGDLPTDNRINPGGTVVVGESYFVSSNAGKFQPSADVGAGEVVSKAGIGVSASLIELLIHNSGATRA